jgi:MFS family permease
MPRWFTFGRDSRVNALLGAGHFLSHFYQLCLPPLFIAWQTAFDVSFAELGLAMAVMAAAAALMQTPMGFLVDRYGARTFLIGGRALANAFGQKWHGREQALEAQIQTERALLRRGGRRPGISIPR